jgi:hypothetical protein
LDNQKTQDNKQQEKRTMEEKTGKTFVAIVLATVAIAVACLMQAPADGNGQCVNVNAPVKKSGGIKTLKPNIDYILERQIQLRIDSLENGDDCPYVSKEQIVLRAIVEDLNIRREQVECEKEALNGLARILSK